MFAENRREHTSGEGRRGGDVSASTQEDKRFRKPRSAASRRQCLKETATRGRAAPSKYRWERLTAAIFELTGGIRMLL